MSLEGQDLCNIVTGSWAVYTNVNFGLQTLILSARVASATAGGIIQVRLGTTNGTLIGTLNVPNTGGWQTYTAVSATLTNAAGVQNLALRFVGGGGYLYLFNLEWLEFKPVSAPVTLLSGGIIGTAGSYNNSATRLITFSIIT